MNNTTTTIAAETANNGSLSDASKVKAAYDALKKMIGNQEIVLATFPVMGSYGLIPKEAIQAYQGPRAGFRGGFLVRQGGI